MNDAVICPSCGKEIPLTEALSRQIQEKYQRFYKVRLEEEKTKLEKSLRERLVREVTDSMELDLKNKANQVSELESQNKALKDQLLELNKLIRQVKWESEKTRIEQEKRITGEQDRIRVEERKRYDEEYRMKMLEYDKKLNDARKMAEEYKRKLEQGSQQLQGEIFELELESVLKREFPQDEILPVPKGVRGADVMQNVVNHFGRKCGTIVWESKRTKSWSEGWIAKLKEDQRDMKADLAVIVSQVLPEGLKNFGLVNGVWVGGFENVQGMALALRAILMEAAKASLANHNRKSKMEILYQYFSGREFTQRLEAIIDSFNNLSDDIEKEKRWYEIKWAKQEKSLRMVFDNLSGMYGDIAGVIGRAMPEVKGLNLLTESLEEGK